MGELIDFEKTVSSKGFLRRSIECLLIKIEAEIATEESAQRWSKFDFVRQERKARRDTNKKITDLIDQLFEIVNPRGIRELEPEYLSRLRWRLMAVLLNDIGPVGDSNIPPEQTAVYL